MKNKSYDKISQSMDETMTQIALAIEAMIECAYIVFEGIANILEKTDQENTDETETKEQKK